jgi:hypothetical protein
MLRQRKGVHVAVTEHQTAVASTVVAALVSVANAVFGWHLSTTDILGIVLPLVGLALAEAHIAHGKASGQGASGYVSELLSGVEKALPSLMSAVQQAQRPAADQAQGSSPAQG